MSELDKEAWDSQIVMDERCGYAITIGMLRELIGHDAVREIYMKWDAVGPAVEGIYVESFQGHKFTVGHSPVHKEAVVLSHEHGWDGVR